MPPSRTLKYASWLIYSWIVLFIIQVISLQFISDSPEVFHDYRQVLFLIFLLAYTAFLGLMIGKGKKWAYYLYVLKFLFISWQSYGVLEDRVLHLPLIGSLIAIQFFVELMVFPTYYSDKLKVFVEWGKKRPRFFLIFINLILVLSIFFTTEFFLRLRAYQPGLLYREINFKTTENLKLNDGFVTDELGITVVSEGADSIIMASIQNGTVPNDDSEIGKRFAGEHLALARDMVFFNAGRVENKFEKFISNITTKNESTLSSVEQAYLNYTRDPINAQGFNSIPFDTFTTDQKKILLIGDSFTWGRSASNLTQNFANNLATNNQVIYNAGITGADPPQYWMIAYKYIEMLKPDLVIINFFMGNDIFDYHREIKSGNPILYSTNAGYIYANPHKETLPTADSAYNFVMREISIPNPEIYFFNGLCSKTVLSTFLWKGLQKMGLVNEDRSYANAEYWKRSNKQDMNKPVSYFYLKEALGFAEKGGAKAIIAIIPDMDELDLKIPKDYPGAFKNLELFVPKGIERKHYREADGHFNDAGHRLFAKSLQAEIDRVFEEKKETNSQESSY